MTKEEKKELARKFCKEVKHLAKEYDLPFFLVTVESKRGYIS